MKLLLNIDVPDLAQAERFYFVAAFGWTALRNLGEDVLELEADGIAIYLLRKPAGSIAAAQAQRDYARHWMPIHGDLVVDDLDRALAQAQAAGALAEGPIREENWGRIVQLSDPFGHGWCLLQFLGRGYDEIA